MKGDPKLIKTLNSLLADELTAINQYMVHSEMCDNWGYEKLHKTIEARAIAEMKHAEKLIARILFLEGIPVVSQLNKMTIGAEVQVQHSNDRGLEQSAIASYNDDAALNANVALTTTVTLSWPSSNQVCWMRRASVSHTYLRLTVGCFAHSSDWACSSQNPSGSFKARAAIFSQFLTWVLPRDSSEGR